MLKDYVHHSFETEAINHTLSTGLAPALSWCQRWDLTLSVSIWAYGFTEKDVNVIIDITLLRALININTHFCFHQILQGFFYRFSTQLPGMLKVLRAELLLLSWHYLFKAIP